MPKQENLKLKKEKGNNLIQSLKKFLLSKPQKVQDNNLVNLEDQYGPEMKLYVKRIYKTWNDVEINLIRDKIRTAIKNNEAVNISELQEFMMYRTLNSIRSKVHGYAQRYFHTTVRTYTQKKIKRNIRRK